MVFRAKRRACAAGSPMHKLVLELALLLPAFLFIVSCSSKDAPLAPSTPAPTPVSIAPPAIVSPAPDEQWGWLEQPVVLTLTNALVSGLSATPITYEFDAARDAVFTQIVYTAKG